MNIERKKKTINRFLGNDKSFSWFLFLLVTVIFTVILYPNLAINRYSYRLGDVAKRDIKAPFDFLIEDADDTEDLGGCLWEILL